MLVVTNIKYKNSTMKCQPRMICIDNSLLEMKMEESSNQPGLSVRNDGDIEDLVIMLLLMMKMMMAMTLVMERHQHDIDRSANPADQGS